MPPPERIDSPRNPTIKHVRALALKKHRDAAGAFLAEGAAVLDRACVKGWEPELLISNGDVPPWGRARRIVASEAVMAALSAQRNPPSIVAVFKQRWGTIPAEPAGTWLMVETLRDPGNLGTMIRTADAVAASGVILAGDCCDPWGPDCVRATMGSIFAVPLIRVAAGEAVKLARGWPGEAVAAAGEGAEDYRRAYAAPTLLAIGSEGSGLSRDLKSACAVSVRIPMPGGTESLNAAVAAVLLLYESSRRT